MNNPDGVLILGSREVWERIAEAAVKIGRAGQAAIAIADEVSTAWHERRERGKSASDVDVANIGRDINPGKLKEPLNDE